MRKASKGILLLAMMIALLVSPAYAQEDARSKAEEVQGILKEMRRTPDLVSPDSIYTATEVKALYYQNIQIIELLKEIRNLLQQQIEKNEE